MTKAASDQPTPAPPAPTVQGVVDDLRSEMIEELCGLAASYARSAAEAAWRGDVRTVKVHLAQLRLTTIAAIKEANNLGSPADSPPTDGGAPA